MANIRSFLKKITPQFSANIYRTIRIIASDKQFMSFAKNVHFIQRFHIIYRLMDINVNIKCSHTDNEILEVIDTILSLPKDANGFIVEAGCFKGGSTAKISIAAKICNRQFVIFDSFEGIPDNSDPDNKDIFGKDLGFPKGSYAGSLDEVKHNVSKYGEIEVCKFVKGWFSDTMPNFSENICVAFLDVDLASSTKDCLKYLYPLIISGGVLFSHDGHVPNVIKVYDDDVFWKQEVGCDKPYIKGLGKSKLLRIDKV